MATMAVAPALTDAGKILLVDDDEAVTEIKRLRAEGWKLREIGSRYNVTEACISQICRGVNRNHKQSGTT